MKKLIFILTLLVLNFCNATAQEKVISGKVLLNNQVTTGVFVQIINPLTNHVIAFDATKTNGNYYIYFNTKLDSVLLKISYISYIEIDTLLKLKNEIINLDFNLQKNNQSLAPVNIIVTKPIQVNGDTTNYNVTSLKNGEKTIEALIKKLPGFEVDEKGKIKFKNKPIKTILLDGDNVVNEDYQIVSKNITPEMVDQIQAIENYNGNELLSGITKGDETVLNLKINKKFKGIVYLKTQASTTIVDSLHEIENTGLAIFKNLKIINIFNRNNIGNYINNGSPPDMTNPEKIGTANALINNDYLSHLSDQSSTKFNNVWQNNFNLLYKKKGLFEITAHHLYFNDLQSSYNHNETTYFNSTPPIKLEEEIQKKEIAKTHKTNLSAKIYITKLSFLTLKAESNFVKSSVSNKNNNTFNTLTNKNSDTVSLNNVNVYFIKKINLKNALETEINTGHKSNQQSLLIVPSLYNTFFNTSNYDSIYQPANLKEKSWNTELRLIGYNTWIKYKFKIGYTNQRVNYNSIIELVKNAAIRTADSLMNNTQISNSNFYLSLTLEKAFIQQKLNIKIENYCPYSTIITNGVKTSNFFYNPDIQLIYKTSTFSNLTLSFNKRNSFGDSKNYVNNYFFRDYKTLEKNNISNTLSEKKSLYSLNYTNVNLFKNQRVIFIGTTYSRNSIFQNHYLENYAGYYIYRSENLNSTINNFSVINYAIASKRIKLLRNTLKFSLLYVINNSKSIQRNSVITKFKYSIVSSNIGLISNFKGSINYDIKIGVNYNQNKTTLDLPNNSFKNITYNASANLHFKVTSKLSSNVSFQYNKNTIMTNYLNADIGYEFSKKDLAISIGGNNLFNNNKIVNYYPTDFFTQRNESKLLSRFVYLKLAYNFSFKL